MHLSEFEDIAAQNQSGNRLRQRRGKARYGTRSSTFAVFPNVYYATFGSLAGKTVRRRILTIDALTGSSGCEVIEAVVDCLNVALT